MLGYARCVEVEIKEALPSRFTPPGGKGDGTSSHMADATCGEDITFPQAHAFFWSGRSPMPERTTHPQHHPQRPQRRSSAPRRVYRRTPYLLLAHGEPLARRAWVRRLRAAGFHVVTAFNGPEALLKAQRCRPMAAILHQTLAGVSGADVAQQLTARTEARAGTPIPVFVIADAAQVDSVLPSLLTHLQAAIGATKVNGAPPPGH
jgi:CheY-like chemotaxis protein